MSCFSPDLTENVNSCSGGGLLTPRIGWRENSPFDEFDEFDEWKKQNKLTNTRRFSSPQVVCFSILFLMNAKKQNKLSNTCRFQSRLFAFILIVQQ